VTDRSNWAVLASCFAIAVGYNAYLIAPASVLPVLSDVYAIDRSAAALSISAAYVGWVLAQLPGGVVMDRFDNRALLAVGVLVLVVAGVAGPFAADYRQFLLWRVGGGATAVFIFTGGVNIVSQSFLAERRGVATSLFVVSAPIGFGIAQYGGPILAERIDWTAAFLAYPLGSAVALPAFLFVATEPVRSDERLDRNALVGALTDPAVLLVSAASFCTYAHFVFLNAWMPTYAGDVLGLSLAAAGGAAALVPLSGIVGRPLGGWLSDRAGVSRRQVLSASLALALPLLALLAVADSVPAFVALLVITGIAVQLGMGVYYAYVSEVASADTAGTSLAVLATFSIAGGLVSPLVAGWSVDAWGWPSAFALVGCLTALGLAFSVLAGRPGRRSRPS